MPEMDAFVEASAGDTDRSGGRGVGGKRWPKQETVMLLKIRSDMDAAFRDASLKGPLWEDVSRKMVEAGYDRSGKKCKEKFENVQKYCNRTKQGREGRQDGKNYKFVEELQALETYTTSFERTRPLDPTPTTAEVNLQASYPVSTWMKFANIGVPVIAATAPPASSPLGLSFSSNRSSSSPGWDNYEGDVGRQPSTAGCRRKRKKVTEASSGSDVRRRMEYLKGLMKRVMQRQEKMQKRFLEAVEKREQDRVDREEAWRRQEIARLTREQELMAHERVVSATRDATIMSFLQKITGQTNHLPSMDTVTAVPVVSSRPLPPPPSSSRRQQYHQTQRPPPPPPVASEQIPSSSRWPKEEVLALISLRSGKELKYQDVGAKGPLWEEISSGLQRLGYRRNPKRCKEKWENINKYFKKVKESNKKRPEEAKTCPYFHELDALYRKKVLGISVDHSERVKNRGPEGEETESTNKPEGNVEEMTPHLEQHQARGADFGNKADDQESESEDEEIEEDRKMASKIEYQERRHNVRTPN